MVELTGASVIPLLVGLTNKRSTKNVLIKVEVCLAAFE
jgi:hypothetical protein